MVAPCRLYSTWVPDPVIAEFVIVRVRSAPPAMLTVLNTAIPALELRTSGEAAAPEAVLELKRNPVPAVDPTKFPFVAVTAPSVAVTVVAEVIDPTVVEMFPADATILPVVAVIPVPPVSVVTEAIDPGAMKVEGIVKVTVAPDAAVVISFAVPASFILPATGVAVPVSPVNVDTWTVPPPRTIHVALFPETEAKP